MESPPPYYSPIPKKSNTGLIVGLILGAVVLCCVLPIGVVGGLGFFGFTKAKGFVGCSFTFKNAQRAVLAYAAANHGSLPKAATWETDVKPYYAKEVKKHADEQKMFGSGSAEGTLGCSNDDGSITGISFNKGLSGKKLSEIKDPMDVVLLYEVATAGSNLNGEYKPQSFEKSPKIFNKTRGWYLAHVQGSPVIVGRNGESTEFKVDTQSSSSDNN